MEEKKTGELKYYKSVKGCPFCGNDSIYKGESVIMHCYSGVDYAWYECEKCGKKWELEKRKVIVGIRELKWKYGK